MATVNRAVRALLSMARSRLYSSLLCFLYRSSLYACAFSVISG